MALIRYAEGQQRSGRLGASIYSHNRFGQYIRAGNIPVNPNTPRQVLIRLQLATLAQRWTQVLTQAQRDAWNAWAAAFPWVNRFGDSVFMPGVNAYMLANGARGQAGLALLDDPPVTIGQAIAPDNLTVSASVATGLITVAWSNTTGFEDEDDGAMVVSNGLGQNPGRTFFGGPWRFADAIPGDSGTPVTSPQTVTATYTLVEGQRMWVRARVLRADGRVSPWALDNFLVGA